MVMELSLLGRSAQLPVRETGFIADMEPAPDSLMLNDEAQLASFGKKQQLKRLFGTFSIVGLTCTLMITWEGTLTVFQSGLTNGGPAGLIYGFIFVWVGTALQTAVMAELASMIPLAGGQYNWVALLAPPWCSKFLSYLTGWMALISWQAALASCAFLAGTMIQGLLVLNYPAYNFQRWHGTLFFYAVFCLSLFINTYLARLLPQFETSVLFIHIIGFFAILIPLVYLAPHGTASDVFYKFTNGGGWSSDGLSFLIGLSTSQFAFLGVDAASHMAEEIKSPSKVIPRSMFAAVGLNGVLGFSMLIATLFCLGDEEAVSNTPTHFPFIAVFNNAAKNPVGTSLMTAVVIAAMVISNVGYLATASRMAWAFARENGMPGSHFLARVDARTSLPLACIGLSTVISLLLALINIGSSTAFSALTSLVIAAFYSTYVISASVLLHKRLTTPASEMHYGPYSMGRAGIPITILAILYSLLGMFFSFWPPSTQVTAETMNWSVVVFGGAVAFGLVFWVIHGRKVYTGPIVETSAKASLKR